MGIFFVWIILSIVVAMWAGGRGRSGFAWFLISALLSPFIAWLVLLVIGKNEAAVEKAAVTEGGMRKCPFCAELVKREAVKCKHCGSELTPEAAPVEQ